MLNVSQHFQCRRKHYRANRIKGKMRVCVFLIFAFVLIKAGPIEDIATVKQLLTAIFDRYKTDMNQLQKVVELTTGDLIGWKQEVVARLEDLELALGAGQRYGEVGHSGEGQGLSGLAARVRKLEKASRITTVRTCHELRKMGIHDSGYYYIDPDGAGIGSPPVEVYCDMRSDTGLTRVNHNQEYEVSVTACREQGCFVRAVNYNIAIRQIVAITALSESCEQYIRYDCKNAPLNSNNQSNAWWTDRNDVEHMYWSGSTDEEDFSGVCGCADQSTCVSDDVRCSCDASLDSWTYDDGHLTSKSQLPVIRLNFGNFYHDGQDARFLLGPLYCNGEGRRYQEMDSCLALWQSGTIRTGYHMRTFGSPGNLKEFVAFDAYLNTPLEDDYRYINFTGTLINIGAGLNPSDGVFVVPVTGTYLFTVHALPRANKPFHVQIHRNRWSVASFSNGKTGQSMVGQSVMLEVAKGDKIRLFNFGGEIYEEPSTMDSFLHFIGVLLNTSDRD